MGSTSSKESPAGKPSYFTIMQGKWGGPWKLVLTPAELEALPEELRAATLSIRAKIGRRNLAYPMPVGAHRCVRACLHDRFGSATDRSTTQQGRDRTRVNSSPGHRPPLDAAQQLYQLLRGKY